MKKRRFCVNYQKQYRQVCRQKHSEFRMKNDEQKYEVTTVCITGNFLSSPPCASLERFPPPPRAKYHVNVWFTIVIRVQAPLGWACTSNILLEAGKSFLCAQTAQNQNGFIEAQRQGVHKKEEGTNNQNYYGSSEKNYIYTQFVHANCMYVCVMI